MLGDVRRFMRKHAALATLSAREIRLEDEHGQIWLSDQDMVGLDTLRLAPVGRLRMCYAKSVLTRHNTTRHLAPYIRQETIAEHSMQQQPE